MRDLLRQIEAGVKSNLYYLSLLAALSVPDMCAALESADGKATGARYAAWFDQNVASTYGGLLDGQTCYQFRCSLLHQGSTQHPANRYARLLFLEPGANSSIFHNNVVNDAFNIDVGRFCYDIIRAAEGWLSAHETSPVFKSNFSKFIQRYPNGIQPYIVGSPVIG